MGSKGVVVVGRPLQPGRTTELFFLYEACDQIVEDKCGNMWRGGPFRCIQMEIRLWYEKEKCPRGMKRKGEPHRLAGICLSCEE